MLSIMAFICGLLFIICCPTFSIIDRISGLDISCSIICKQMKLFCSGCLPNKLVSCLSFVPPQF